MKTVKFLVLHLQTSEEAIVGQYTPLKLFDSRFHPGSLFFVNFIQIISLLLQYKLIQA